MSAAPFAEVPAGGRNAYAWSVAAEVRDPEMPVLTLADLGVLREVVVADGGGVEVALTPTYSGCPATAEMQADVTARLAAAGFAPVTVRLVLDPPWSSDWITPAGRAALAASGISPPGPAPRHVGPVPLRLAPVRRALTCPRCGAFEVALASEFGATPCVAQYRCEACGEPFDHVKEI